MLIQILVVLAFLLGIGIIGAILVMIPIKIMEYLGSKFKKTNTEVQNNGDRP